MIYAQFAYQNRLEQCKLWNYYFFFLIATWLLKFLMILWWSILVANLATNFQDLIAKVKNSVTLAPVLGAISCPVKV